MPKILTVGIPYYKNTKLDHLISSIDSVLDQTLTPDEVHMIQDGPVSKEIEQVVNY